MQIICLGTASCYPTASRSVSCTAVRFEGIAFLKINYKKKKGYYEIAFKHEVSYSKR